MKHILTLLLLLVPLLHNGQSAVSRSPKEEYEVVFSLFKKEIEPYLRKFSQEQYSPDIEKNKLESLVTSMFLSLKQRVELIHQEGYSQLLESKEFLSNPDKKKQIAFFFEFRFRNEFPGLDYVYFDKVNSALSKL